MEKETFVYGVDNFYELKNNSWSGALQTLEQVEERGAEEQVLDLINELISTYEQGLTETQLNDYIWFDLENDLKEYYNIDLWEEEEN